MEWVRSSGCCCIATQRPCGIALVKVWLSFGEMRSNLYKIGLVWSIMDKSRNFVKLFFFYLPWNAWSRHQLLEISYQSRAPVVKDGNDYQHYESSENTDETGDQCILGFWIEEEAAHVPHEGPKQGIDCDLRIIMMMMMVMMIMKQNTNPGIIKEA